MGVGGRTWSIGNVAQFNYHFDRMDLEMVDAMTDIDSDSEQLTGNKDQYTLKAEEAGHTLPLPLNDSNKLELSRSGSGLDV